jgi:hypothetical protein
MIESGFDHSTQKALIYGLRRRAKPQGAPAFVMTRSSTILNLALVGPNKTIVL